MCHMSSVSIARESRRYVEHVSSQHRVAAEPDDVTPSPVRAAKEYRVDLERLRFSSYFARLSDVTQVVPRSGVGPVMHNRLSHSLKVSAVARVIAANLAERQARHLAFVSGSHPTDDETGRIIARLGGCDSIVTQ